MWNAIFVIGNCQSINNLTWLLFMSPPLRTVSTSIVIIGSQEVSCVIEILRKDIYNQHQLRYRNIAERHLQSTSIWSHFSKFYIERPSPWQSTIWKCDLHHICRILLFAVNCCCASVLWLVGVEIITTTISWLIFASHVQALSKNIMWWRAKVLYHSICCWYRAIQRGGENWY